MPRVPKLIIYEDEGGGFRWRLRTANGRNIGNPGEPYKDERNAHRAALDLKESVVNAEIIFEAKPKLAVAKKAPAKKAVTKKAVAKKPAVQKPLEQFVDLG